MIWVVVGALNLTDEKISKFSYALVLVMLLLAIAGLYTINDQKIEAQRELNRLMYEEVTENVVNQSDSNIYNHTVCSL